VTFTCERKRGPFGRARKSGVEQSKGRGRKKYVSRDFKKSEGWMSRGKREIASREGEAEPNYYEMAMEGLA